MDQLSLHTAQGIDQYAVGSANTDQRTSHEHTVGSAFPTIRTRYWQTYWLTFPTSHTRYCPKYGGISSLYPPYHVLTIIRMNQHRTRYELTYRWLSVSYPTYKVGKNILLDQHSLPTVPEMKKAYGRNMHSYLTYKVWTNVPVNQRFLPTVPGMNEHTVRSAFPSNSARYKHVCYYCTTVYSADEELIETIAICSL